MLEQRAITRDIARVFPCRVVFAEGMTKTPRTIGDTDLSQWIDDEEAPSGGLFILGAGAVALRIDAPAYLRRAFFAALDYLHVDTRFRWSRASEPIATHCLVKFNSVEEQLLGRDRLRLPAPIVMAGNKAFLTMETSYHTRTVRDIRYARAPGTLKIRRDDIRNVEPLVWRARDGDIPHNVVELHPSAPSVVAFRDIVRAFAFAVMRETMKDERSEARARVLTGWLARSVREAENSLQKDIVYAVVNDEEALQLIAFVDPGPGAAAFFTGARARLRTEPDSIRIPGRRALAEILGRETERNLRLTFFPGVDMGWVEILADQYIQNKDTSLYIDRYAFNNKRERWQFTSGEISEWNKEKEIKVGDKKMEAFRIFAASDLRIKVEHTIFSPLHGEGRVLRYAHGRVVEADYDKSEGYLIFNAWGGLPVKPIPTIDAGLMRECGERLERLLFGLTRDNRSQADWIKRWLAWTLQHPAEKQQVALILFGGQNIGKSFFGVRFLPAIFRHLAGTAEGDNLNEQFWVAPYLNKLIVFLDEAVFRERSSVERAKRLVRNVQIAGEQKGQDPRQYDVYARLVLASNRKNIGLGSDNLYDRGFFPVLGDGPEYQGMTETEFQIRRIEANGDFFEEYDAFLQRPIVQAHYVRMFLDMPVRKGEVEDLSHSSAADREILMANLSAAKQVAKELLESGTFTLDTRDMMEPFSREEFFKRAAALARDMGGRRPASAAHVWNELAVLELFEPAGTKWKLRYEREEVFRQVEKAWGVRLNRAHPAYGDHRG